MSYFTKPLVVFELANNHQGSLEHGLRIIHGVHEASLPFRERFQLGFKFQYRNLDTFLHPAWRNRDDVKFVKRFRETRLQVSEFQQLKMEADRLGFVSVCTPFDEDSVGQIEQQGFTFLKIASCSLTDWPLLERIAKTDKPIIASTAGASLEDIDNVASFLRHRDKDFALMYCVAEYPTPDEHLDLGQIELLRNRYADVPVGYSTHECPDNFNSIQIAIAKGATIFEKHVGIATEKVVLNGYSATPEQIRRWLESAERAFRMIGITGQRRAFSESEISSLFSLRRAAFAARPLHKGERIAVRDVFFAIPGQPGQLTANDFSKYVDFHASSEIEAQAPLLAGEIRRVDRREKVFRIVQKVTALIRGAGIVVPGQADFEISHHYGIERYEEVGATLISFVNRSYCKKLMVLLPGQSHPEHWHDVKEETFMVVSGDVTITLNGTAKEFGRGDIILVERGVKHSFFSRTGAAIEELSSTHHGEDSYYTDPNVPPTRDRKTLVTYWMDSRASDWSKGAMAGR